MMILQCMKTFKMSRGKVTQKNPGRPFGSSMNRTETRVQRPSWPQGCLAIVVGSPDDDPFVLRRWIIQLHGPLLDSVDMAARSPLAFRIRFRRCRAAGFPQIFPRIFRRGIQFIIPDCYKASHACIRFPCTSAIFYLFFNEIFSSVLMPTEYRRQRMISATIFRFASSFTSAYLITESLRA